MMPFDLDGYAGSMLRIDLSKGKITKLPLDKNTCKLYLGGRGYDAKILFNETTPETDPLGPENVLCISTGPLTGLLGPTTGRVNAAARSPMTDIYGNSNAGAHWGPELKFAGYDRVIITGRSEKPYYLSIEDDTVELRDAERLMGEGVFETTLSIQEETNGYETKVLAVGPASENGVLYGNLIFDLWDAAARTGLGTVMASKNLKAIAVTGTGNLKVANPKKFMEIARDGWLGIINDPGFKMGEHQALGTAVCVGWGNAQGWLPTRNFREAIFEGAEEISGEEFRDKYSTKESPIPGGRACFSCPNRCKRFGKVASGKYAGTRGNIEFEGIGAFGSRCGVSDLEAVFHAFSLSNDYGLDCISCGNMIATMMEWNQHGLMPQNKLDGLDLKFGNAEAMVEMVHKIANREGFLGTLGALGPYKAAHHLGGEAWKYVSAVKGLDSISCDPRVAKGFGFTYAVSSRGSDHLRAHSVYEMIRMPEELSKELFGSEEASHYMKYGGKVEMVVYHEDLAAVTDSIGSCRFMHASYYAQYPFPEKLAEIRGKKGSINSIKYHEWLSAATGLEIGYEDLLGIGSRIITLERAINTRFGIRKEHDTLPYRFLKEQVPAGRGKGQIYDENQLKKMVDRYYDMRGWNKETGLVTEEKMFSSNMKDVLEDLRQRELISS